MKIIERVVKFYLPFLLVFFHLLKYIIKTTVHTNSSGSITGAWSCSNKTLLRLDFCRFLNVKLSDWGFSLLNFQPIGDSFTFRHLQKSCLSTVLLEQRACPSSSEQPSKASPAHFYVKLALFKHDFLSRFQVKWPLSWVHLKAENMTMSKLTLFVKIWVVSPEISSSKHERAFFLDTLYTPSQDTDIDLNNLNARASAVTLNEGHTRRVRYADVVDTRIRILNTYWTFQNPKNHHKMAKLANHQTILSPQTANNILSSECLWKFTSQGVYGRPMDFRNVYN